VSKSRGSRGANRAAESGVAGDEGQLDREEVVVEDGEPADRYAASRSWTSGVGRDSKGRLMRLYDLGVQKRS
jgi:hypothetical protein